MASLCASCIHAQLSIVRKFGKEKEKTGNIQYGCMLIPALAHRTAEEDLLDIDGNPLTDEDMEEMEMIVDTDGFLNVQQCNRYEQEGEN